MQKVFLGYHDGRSSKAQMFSKFPVIRRVSIYLVLSYAGLVLVNNSGYQLENMWVLYAPMFIGVYIFSRWIDSKLVAKDGGK